MHLTFWFLTLTDISVKGLQRHHRARSRVSTPVHNRYRHPCEDTCIQPFDPPFLCSRYSAPLTLRALTERVSVAPSRS
ncbi:hypothetical protein BD626DRAFT_503386 [Schizophyllum amplum]|uniref:Uncharacterized protein n=1 Tax=Schizophyllum amplum TaxID=97359 RepID=A0A550C855_9AGAR|nr:hypothetical protein BD626DRAFT_503386 [Auriculariopsis ampla]